MKTRTPARLSLEQLEDRCTPAVTASVLNGTLTVAGFPVNPGATINILQIANNQFQVRDGNTLVGAGTFSATSVGINLTGSGDTVNVDLGGKVTAGQIAVNLESGNNTANVADGTLAGQLGIGGTGNDFVSLGGTAGALRVGLNTTVNLPGGSDGLLVNSNVALSQNLLAYYVTDVTLSPGSAIGANFNFTGNAPGNTVIADGAIGGGIAFFAPASVGNLNVPSSLTLGVGATVAGSVVFQSALNDSHGSILNFNPGSLVRGNVYFTGTHQSDTLNLNGTIGQSVFANSWGPSTFNVGGNVGINLTVGMWGALSAVNVMGPINGSASLGLIGGDSTVDLSGTVGRAFNVTMQGGGNLVQVNEGALIQVGAVINLGNGANQLVFNGAVGTGTNGFALWVTGTTGNNLVTLGSDVPGATAANIVGNAMVSLGGNSNIVRLKDATRISGVLSAAAANATSTLIGSANAFHPRLSLAGFKVVGGANP